MRIDGSFRTKQDVLPPGRTSPTPSVAPSPNGWAGAPSASSSVPIGSASSRDQGLPAHLQHPEGDVRRVYDRNTPEPGLATSASGWYTQAGRVVMAFYAGGSRPGRGPRNAPPAVVAAVEDLP
jgi:hypothetical protein